VVAAGGSAFDVIYNCDGEIMTTSCDAANADGAICDTY
jgi:hypothetical protein